MLNVFWNTGYFLQSITTMEEEAAEKNLQNTE